MKKQVNLIYSMLLIVVVSCLLAMFIIHSANAFSDNLEKSFNSTNLD